MKQTPMRLLLFGAAAVILLAACLLMGASGFGLPALDSPIGRAILSLRINRIICGFLVGAALASSGVILQAVLRNPLAEPYVLGVSSGAGLGAAFAILTGLTTTCAIALPACAFVAAAVTLLIVYMLARSGGATSIYGLILSGVIVSSICSSILMFLVATAPAEGLHSVLWWMLGNLQPSSSNFLGLAGALILAALVFAWFQSIQLNALALGHETAHNVGVRLNVSICIALGTATFMTATAVSMAGLIGFVGLVVPHVCRRVFGAEHRRLLPIAAVFGGVFLAVCDAIARTVLAPREIPVGVVTALVGGPFFLSVLRQKRKKEWPA